MKKRIKHSLSGQPEFHDYQSEADFLMQMLKNEIRLRENNLMDIFVFSGPAYLRETLGLNQGDYQLLFDRLVIGRGVLKQCASEFFPFFQMIIEDSGFDTIRKIFGIEDTKYDQVFLELRNFFVQRGVPIALYNSRRMHGGLGA